jgi:hypothetical protein
MQLELDRLVFQQQVERKLAEGEGKKINRFLR